jgi:GAF domain-containing protein
MSSIPPTGVLHRRERLDAVTNLLGADEARTMDLRIAARIVAQQFAAKAVTVNLVTSDTVVTIAGHGLPDVSIETAPAPAPWAPCTHVIEAGKPVVIQDLNTGGADRAVPVPGMSLYLGVPLAAHGETVGTLCLYFDRTMYDPTALVPWLARVGNEVGSMMTTGDPLGTPIFDVMAAISRAMSTHVDRAPGGEARWQ